jgi:hypothetical protein
VVKQLKIFARCINKMKVMPGFFKISATEEVQERDGSTAL